MNSISVTYTTKYRLKFANNYEFTLCKKCVNIRTNRIIKKVYNNGSIGYCINGRFYSLTFLRTQLEKIPKKEYCPFT